MGGTNFSKSDVYYKNHAYQTKTVGTGAFV